MSVLLYDYVFVVIIYIFIVKIRLYLYIRGIVVLYEIFFFNKKICVQVSSEGYGFLVLVVLIICNVNRFMGYIFYKRVVLK